jgi:membrane protease YdiL (CAAX protease family)
MKWKGENEMSRTRRKNSKLMQGRYRKRDMTSCSFFVDLTCPIYSLLLPHWRPWQILIFIFLLLLFFFFHFPLFLSCLFKKKMESYVQVTFKSVVVQQVQVKVWLIFGMQFSLISEFILFRNYCQQKKCL